jgi:hypothetical protein
MSPELDADEGQGPMAEPQTLRALQQRIQSLVGDLHAADAAVPSVFRNLCRLARDWESRMNAEAFRSRLVRAGLAASRASEIKTVLRSQFRDRFIAGRLTWPRTLAKARRQIWQLTQLHQSAARVAGLMHRHRIFRVARRAGSFELQVRPGFSLMTSLLTELATGSES